MGKKEEKRMKEESGSKVEKVEESGNWRLMQTFD